MTRFWDVTQGLWRAEAFEMEKAQRGRLSTSGRELTQDPVVERGLRELSAEVAVGDVHPHADVLARRGWDDAVGILPGAARGGWVVGGLLGDEGAGKRQHLRATQRHQRLCV